jgi:hypothetical protein
MLFYIEFGRAELRHSRKMPAGDAKPDVRAISDSEAGAYCTVGLVFPTGPFIYIQCVLANIGTVHLSNMAL